MPLSALKYFRAYLLDLIFPKFCLGCKKEGMWLCPDCQAAIKANTDKTCPICKQINENGSVCGSCRKKSYLDGLWVLADYDDRLIQDLIKAIKYDYICELSANFGCLAEKYFAGLPLNKENLFLLPMPLHRRRQLERGFNQAEIIAGSIGKIMGLPLIDPLLVRKKYLKAQAKLSREERIANIRSAFSFNKRFLAVSKLSRIILVDDVYTTGATMQECAKILKNEGFNNVWGLVVARGN